MCNEIFAWSAWLLSWMIFFLYPFPGSDRLSPFVSSMWKSLPFPVQASIIRRMFARPPSLSFFYLLPLLQPGDLQGVALPQHVWFLPQRGWRASPLVWPFIINPLPPEIILRNLPEHSGQTITGVLWIDCLTSLLFPQSSQTYSYNGTIVSLHFYNPELISHFFMQRNCRLCKTNSFG